MNKERVNIEFVIINQGNACRRHCVPAYLLRDLHSKGALKHLISAMADKPLPGEPAENCHNIAIGLMGDLMILDIANGWNWIKGKHHMWPVTHSWLEFDGWAVDAAATSCDNIIEECKYILFADYKWYRRWRGQKVIKSRNSRQFRRWLHNRSACLISNV